MVEGKTAALLAFSLESGALCAGVSPKIQSNYRNFGRYLGLAFQVQDDILGIWGKQEQIGKSNTGDLITGKKTLPVLYGLSQKKEFSACWFAGSISLQEAPHIRQLLEEEGALAYAQENASRLTDLALNALKNAQPDGKAGNALHELAQQLLDRKT
jgi:geranylgeranyl diphosphate synthase type I